MKIITNIFFIAIPVLIIACSGKTEGTATFGMRECIKLADNEKVLNADDKIYELYDSTCVPPESQIPLNKTIKSRDGYIFIGMAYLTNLSALKENLRDFSGHEVIELKEFNDNGNNYVSFFAKTPGYFKLSVIYDNPSGGLFLINYLQDDSVKVREKYDDKNYIMNKLACGE